VITDKVLSDGASTKAAFSEPKIDAKLELKGSVGVEFRTEQTSTVIKDAVEAIKEVF